MVRLIAFLLAFGLSCNVYATSVVPNMLGANTQCCSFADLVDKVVPAVVNISTTQKVEPKNKLFSFHDLPDNFQDLFDFFDELNPRKSRKMRSLGSGFIVDPEGYIVTNYHNIAQADEIEVTLKDDDSERYKAKVIGKDARTDLALLKINAKKPLPSVKFGDSSKSRVGDWIIAIGNPFGLGGTVTAGIISAKARYLNGAQFDDLIQTDASINRGNSGGPMFNMQGEVIGVNTLIISSSGGNMGIGFAIPSEIVEPIIDQLQNKGEIIRGWLGVKIQPVDEHIAKAMGLKKAKGAIVAEVMKDSPAEKAGIKPGDIITKFGDKDVSTINKLLRMVSEAPINNKVTMQVFRDGKFLTLSTVIEKPERDIFADEEDEQSQPSSKEKEGQIILGMRVADLNNSLRKKYKIDPSLSGVVVTGLNRNSPAVEVGISVGDLIQKVGNHKVTSVKDFEHMVNKTKESGAKKIILFINKEGENRFFPVELE